MSMKEELSKAKIEFDKAVLKEGETAREFAERLYEINWVGLSTNTMDGLIAPKTRFSELSVNVQKAWIQTAIRKGAPK